MFAREKPVEKCQLSVTYLLNKATLVKLRIQLQINSSDSRQQYFKYYKILRKDGDSSGYIFVQYQLSALVLVKLSCYSKASEHGDVESTLLTKLRMR